MNIDERISVLKQTNIFSSLAKSSLEVIAGFAKEVPYADKEVIFREGEVGNCLYIIAKGKLKINHKTAEITTLSTYDIVGEMSLLDDSPRSATAVAVGETVLLLITQIAYLKIISYLPEVSLEIGKLLAQRIRQDNIRNFQQYLELQNQKILERELEIAQQIQKRLLPQRFPHFPNLGIEAKCLSAKKVGGDFFGFVTYQAHPEKLGIITGDVSGKGISGAIIMANAKGIICAEASDHVEPSITMKEANGWLVDDTPKNMFLALFYGILDTETLEFRYSCVGQPLPLVLRHEKSAPFYVPKNDFRIPLGVFPKANYDEKKVHLQPDDLIVFCSDGIVEATNQHEEMWGFDNLENVVSKCRGLNAKEALDQILEEVETFIGEKDLYDDLTLLVIKIKNESFLPKT